MPLSVNRPLQDHALVATGAFTFTAGFGGLLLPLWWFVIMFHVYGIEDRIGPPTDDEGEQY